MSHNHTFRHAGSYKYRIALTFVNPRGGEGQNGRLKCPLGFLVSTLQYYRLRYKCDDCLYSYFEYVTLYGFNRTSVSIPFGRGSRYTVMMRVQTRYGPGKWAQTMAVASSELGPVLNLKASLDSSSQDLVHLTWNAPSHKSIKVVN